jgi:hypothetical protein
MLLCSGLLGAEPSVTSTKAPDHQSDYSSAASQAGRDPQAHVRLALWCEAHGMTAERLKHLAMAILIDPTHATARGLMGLVPYQGQWQSPERVSERVRDDGKTAALLADYNGMRASARNTVDSQWKLALWCEKHGLKPEAIAHFTAVTRLDPKHEAAWKRLGYRRHKHRWMTDAEIAAETAEVEAQRAADRHWRPRLAAWRTALSSATKRDEAEQELAQVTDPRAVRSVWAVFGRGDAEHQRRAVQLLGQIASPPATRALATLAVQSNDVEVRRLASELVLARDPRDAFDLLIGSLRDPIKFDVRAVGGPGVPGALLVEGQRFNTEFVYAPPSLPLVPMLPGDAVKYDAFGLPFIDRHNVTTTRAGTTTTTEDDEFAIPVGRMVLETQFAAVSAQRQLLSDVATIEKANEEIAATNERIASLLERATGQNLGTSRESWAAWWTDHQGYSYRQAPQPLAKPTAVQVVPLAFRPTSGPIALGSSVSSVTLIPFASRSHSCFGAGTQVRTLAGPRAIETIRVGDEVLSQDPATGALDYKPVLSVFHNSPSETLRIRLGNDEVVATGIHRFWLAGKGWVMARDLKPHDKVRSIGGTSEVTSVETDRVQPVFNLEVAGSHSYFVGECGSLVHDNSLVQPTAAPFDALALSPASR